MVNYTTESKIKSIHNDNYTEKSCGVYVSCWQCIFCGKNKDLPVFKDNLLCAKYIKEVAIVEGAGTCESAKSRFSKLSFINPIKKWILEKSGFDFKAR